VSAMAGTGRAVRLDKFDVSGVLPDAGPGGIVGAGMLEEDRDTEGNTAVRLAVLRPANCASICRVAVFAIRLALQ
jgi:hypothetical protein